MIATGENQHTQKKPVPLPLCPPQIPYGMALRSYLDLNSERLASAWATAQPSIIETILSTQSLTLWSQLLNTKQGQTHNKLTFIIGMLFDMAMEEPISSCTISDGEASSGWLLVEVGERYIQARLVTETFHRVNRTIHQTKTHFCIKIWWHHYIRMQWNVFSISATSIYNKTVIFNDHPGIPTNLHLTSSWTTGSVSVLYTNPIYLLCCSL